eukprot:424046-Prorocentrum_lima.AAC.1
MSVGKLRPDITSFRSVGGTLLQQGASFSSIGSGFLDATRAGMQISDVDQKNCLLYTSDAADDM